jgi:Tfp pilus assembly protein PilW
MSTDSARGGFTVAEFVVASAVASLLLIAVGAMTMYSWQNFLVTGNIVDLDRQSRLGLDTMSRDIRQADAVLACSASTLSLRSSSNTIDFVFDASAHTVRRTSAGANSILMTDCDYIRYDMYQRNATNGTYDYYPAASTNTCKVVQVTFACSKPVYGTVRHNTGVQQAARIVIRKQK